jgi:hypothetical protein
MNPMRMFAPVDAASIAVFRIAFGGLVLWNLLDFCLDGLIEPSYVAPQFHFTYYGCGWVRPWPGAGMYLHVYGLMLLAGCVMLGLAYRFAAWLLFLGYTYLFLLEATFYLNHEYLICLLALIMACVPAHRAWSLDVLLRPEIACPTAPAWSLYLLRFQIAVPYFFGGLAKLDSDWLRMMPAKIGLAEREELPLVGRLLSDPWGPAVVADGGLGLDLAIVPLLLWRRTRLPAFVFAVLFHACNAMLFNIGVFPWLMIAGTALFFRPDWPRRLLGIPRSDGSDAAPGGIVDALPGGCLSVRQKAAVAGLAAYVAVQALLPLRQHLYAGNPSWTEQGHRFAWRMMLVHKRGYAWMYAVDPRTRQAVPIDVRPLLSRWQLRYFAHDPDRVLQLAHHVSRELQRGGFGNQEVRAIALISLNGRKPQLLIDPQVNLATTPRRLGRATWVLPLSEPLPEEPWAVPVSEWMDRLEIDAESLLLGLRPE